MSTKNSEKSVASLRVALVEAKGVVAQLEMDLVAAEAVELSGAEVIPEPVPFFGNEYFVGPTLQTDPICVEGVPRDGEFKGSCSAYVRAYLNLPDGGYHWTAFFYSEAVSLEVGANCFATNSFAEAVCWVRAMYAKYFPGVLAIAA